MLEMGPEFPGQQHTAVDCDTGQATSQRHQEQDDDGDKPPTGPTRGRWGSH
jgi:hypothetical protein